MTKVPTQADRFWWKTAAVYQVYIRSFRDGDGNGVGDIAGLIAGLDHIAGLGVDAIWINPWYPSPQLDGGYDVSDYRDIEPEYGTLEQAGTLVEEAHRRGLRVILDVVPNHTSSRHPWFQAALAGDARAQARYLFREGRGPGGDEPPNDWKSVFGGSAWERVTAGPVAGKWYLHLFAVAQPDLDWTNPEVEADFEETLRFWFDRGVDGFRIDVANALHKDPELPDAGDAEQHHESHPAWDQDAVHEVFRAWRRIADAQDPPRVFVAEAWVGSAERLARYLRPDELHTAFQFDFLKAPFRAATMREVVTEELTTAEHVGAPSTWVLSNHDVPRHLTRYARSQPEGLADPALDNLRWADEPADLELGRRRARAALLVALALPGTVYLYQGEELGLPEVEDIAPERRRDPLFEQSGRTLLGRDGCRVPLPWAGDAPPYSFSAHGASAEPWLPQPDDWAPLTAAAQEGAAGSMLELYRSALHLRREHWLEGGELQWVEADTSDVLAFRRGAVECWLNTGTTTVALPPGELLLASADLEGGELPANAAVWLRPVAPRG